MAWPATGESAAIRRRVGLGAAMMLNRPDGPHHPRRIEDLVSRNVLVADAVRCWPPTMSEIAGNPCKAPLPPLTGLSKEHMKKSLRN